MTGASSIRKGRSRSLAVSRTGVGGSRSGMGGRRFLLAAVRLARQPVLAPELPDHLRDLAADAVGDPHVDQAGTLLFLDAARRLVPLGVGQAKGRPAEVAEGVVGHTVGRFGHEALSLELGVEPEAALAAIRAVIGPEVD